MKETCDRTSSLWNCLIRQSTLAAVAFVTISTDSLAFYANLIVTIAIAVSPPNRDGCALLSLWSQLVDARRALNTVSRTRALCARLYVSRIDSALQATIFLILYVTPCTFTRLSGHMGIESIDSARKSVTNASDEEKSEESKAEID